MKVLIAHFVTLVVLFGLGSCSSATYVVDYDDSINFAQYSTYNFTPSADSIPVNQLVKKRLFDALSKTMNENNIRWAAEPDLYLHVHLMMKGNKKADITYGHGETLELGTGFSTTYSDRDQYSEGTLFFDIIDSRRKNLVWTARATDQIKGDAPLSEKEISRIVEKAFKNFPPKPPK